MDSKKYNGWDNYETWLTNLWLDNDGYGSMIEEQAVSCLSDVEDNDDDMATADLADWLKGFVTEELLPDLGATFAADLLNAAISEVNWFEIADHYITDAA